jgi:transglutaminase-like putative cysteine protease
MHFYFVRHLTKFIYGRSVSESAMEVRMHPRSDSNQRCLSFTLSVSPRCRVFTYRDHLGNNIHHFDIPGRHAQLVIVAEAVVEHQPLAMIPGSLGRDAWRELDALVAEGDYWEMLLPSEFARTSPALLELAKEFGAVRRDDPLKLLHEINARLYEEFSYEKQTTRVDSPIEEALRTRQGVCQDFAHIMIALVRHLKIPCRYVSGYLYHQDKSQDRSPAGATHAWVEAYLGELGWVAFDPTNNLEGCDRHVRVAVGRDYSDVPPTRGIYKGEAESELSVVVTVFPVDAPEPEEMPPTTVVRSRSRYAGANADLDQQQQQQQ